MPHHPWPLRFFEFVRAQGGLANDGDQLILAVRCGASSTLPEELDRIAPGRVGRPDERGILSIYLAGGDGDPYAVGEADVALARRLEGVLQPYGEQVFIPNVNDPRGYWAQLREWEALTPVLVPPAPSQAAPSAAPLQETPPASSAPVEQAPSEPPATDRLPSEPLSHHNLLAFLAEQPDPTGPAEFTDGNQEAPAHWEKLGSLRDEALGMTIIVHRNASAIAVGFYPYNDCDIYRDSTTGDILLSYLDALSYFERSSIRITKDSPFLFEPVSCALELASQRLEEFHGAMREFGLTKEDIEAQVRHYSSMYDITEPLPTDRITFVGSAPGAPGAHRFVIVANRRTATELRRRFHTPLAVGSAG